MMKLHRMLQSEFDVWAPRSRASYASDKIRANGYTQSEANAIAEADFNRLLPDGIDSKDNYLFTAKNEAQAVGFIWFCVRGSVENQRAFICDVMIEEDFRGKGFGKQMMNLIEVEIRSLGVRRIGLHVFGFNEIAIALYRSLGYSVTDLSLEKTLTET